MEQIKVKDIVKATKGVLLCGDENVSVLDLCFNSKEVKPGDLFIPLIGEKVDGHRFIESALERGAVATLTSHHDNVVISDKPYIRVDNTLEALQAIGRYIRSIKQQPIVAVTGSVGKTTTREMIAAALSTQKNVLETIKNYNSQIGVPIMLSKLNKDHEMAVLELGMSEPGQMHILSELVRPQICVVTTIGIAHIEYLKTQENIRKEKLSVIDCMTEDGILFLNGDDVMLAEMRGKMPCKTYYYGCQPWCDFKAENIRYEAGKSYFDCVYEDKRVPVELNVLGEHNVGNCLAALGVAYVSGIPIETAAQGFQDFSGQRQKVIIQENKFTIIDDTYNASPASVKASVNVLCDMPCEGRRVAVLGDMFELGPDAEKYHYELGEFIAEKNIDELVVIGELSKHIRQAVLDSGKPIKTCSFMDNEEAAISLMAILQPEDIVLIKGSNGMHMNEIVKLLQA